MDNFVGVDGNAIARILGQDGAQRDAEQSSVASRPIYKTGILNGKPIARFDGVDDLFNLSIEGGGFNVNADILAPARASKKAEFFIVYKATGVAIEGILDLGTSAGSAWPLANDHFQDACISQTQLDLGVAASSPRAGFIIFNGSIDQNIPLRSYWVNGTLLLATGVAFGLGVPGSPNLGATSVGKFAGDFAEYVFYASTLTIPQRNAIKNYLATKYGIAVV